MTRGGQRIFRKRCLREKKTINIEFLKSIKFHQNFKTSGHESHPGNIKLADGDRMCSIPHLILHLLGPEVKLIPATLTEEN